MFNIPLFKAEKEAGLTSKDLAKASISYIVECEEDKNFDLSKVSDKIKGLCKSVASVTQDIVLYPLKSILVSTIWNGNDDYMHPHEIWAARYSGKDKPFNYEHNCDDIIGHSTASYAVDEDGHELPDSLTLDELPEKYHIISKDVIYRFWSKEDLQERMDKIITEIPNGKWFVSVEALFPNFDYALRDEKGNFKILARTNETSFLTEMLRCYGGKGVYEGYQVGRVPRNMIFSGKGLVAKPANPESIILAKKYELISEIKNPVYDILTNKQNVNEVKSDMDEKEFKTQLEAKNSEIAKLQASLAEINVKEFKTQIDSLTKSKTDLESQVASTNSLLETATNELKSAQTKVADVEKARLELAERLTKIESEKKNSDRLALIVSKLKYDEAKAKKLLDNLVVLSDEAFAANIDIQAELITSTASVETKIETKVTESKKADEKVLDNVEASEKIAALNSSKIENGVEQVRASIAGFLSGYVTLDETEDK